MYTGQEGGQLHQFLFGKLLICKRKHNNSYIIFETVKYKTIAVSELVASAVAKGSLSFYAC